MSEINTRENVFLAKLDQMVSAYDEIDKIVNDIKSMIGALPATQSKIDSKLSDYYHIIEDKELSDEQLVKIGKKIHDVRIERRDANSVNELINVYNKYKDKLFHCPTTNRDEFREAIKECRDHLHDTYRYRVLTDDDLKEFNDTPKKVSMKKSEKESKIKECFEKGMKNKDISKELKLTPSYVSHLKRQLGFETRKYNSKKGE